MVGSGFGSNTEFFVRNMKAEKRQEFWLCDRKDVNLCFDMSNLFTIQTVLALKKRTHDDEKQKHD
jgi:hypothetical protein